VKALRTTTLAVALSAALASPAAANPTGGLSYAETDGGAGGTTGGAAYGMLPTPPRATPTPHPPKPQPTEAPATKAPSRLAARPQLAAFSLAPPVLTPGQAPTLTFNVTGRAPTIRLRLVVSWPGTGYPERQVDLGRQPANVPQTISLASLADPSLPEGPMSVRIAGRDSAGRILRPGVRLSRVTQVEVRGHVFPLRGVFSYGGPDARFGAKRDGHIHQGQDLLAAEGTPVVAPRSGTIEYVGYQAGGAGYYVVLDGDGEDLDYAFMHLQQGSTLVVKGQPVDQGQRLGSVGRTGDAQGDHLHFEVWQGPWYAGGHAVDPLPYLQLWQTWSPVRAI
jgi:hypothetical protein